MKFQIKLVKNVVLVLKNVQLEQKSDYPHFSYEYFTNYSTIQHTF